MAATVTWEKVGTVLVPALLTILIGVLSWMAANIAEINRTLAVAVQRVDELDRRVSNLETLYLHPR